MTSPKNLAFATHLITQITLHTATFASIFNREENLPATFIEVKNALYRQENGGPNNSPLSVKWATSYLLVQNQVPFLLRSLFARPDRSGCQLPMQGSHPGRGLLVDVDHRKTLCHDRSPEQSNPGP